MKTVYKNFNNAFQLSLNKIMYIVDNLAQNRWDHSFHTMLLSSHRKKLRPPNLCVRAWCEVKDMLYIKCLSLWASSNKLNKIFLKAFKHHWRRLKPVYCIRL